MDHGTARNAARWCESFGRRAAPADQTASIPHDGAMVCALLRLALLSQRNLSDGCAAPGGDTTLRRPPMSEQPATTTKRPALYRVAAGSILKGARRNPRHHRLGHLSP